MTAISEAVPTDRLETLVKEEAVEDRIPNPDTKEDNAASNKNNNITSSEISVLGELPGNESNCMDAT